MFRLGGSARPGYQNGNYADLVKEIQKDLPKKYNFLHYRYEDDFIAHFRIKNHKK